VSLLCWSQLRGERERGNGYEHARDGVATIPLGKDTAGDPHEASQRSADAHGNRIHLEHRSAKPYPADQSPETQKKQNQGKEQ